MASFSALPRGLSENALKMSFPRRRIGVNLRIFPFIMATCSQPIAFHKRSRRASHNRQCAARWKPPRECSPSIAGHFHPQSVLLVVEPTKILVLIAKPLGMCPVIWYVMAKTLSNPLLMEDFSCRLSVLTTEERAIVHSIEQVLPREQIELLARQSGAIQRIRKVNPMSLLGALCLLALHSSCSLRLTAMFMGMLDGCVLSKQALKQRINNAWSNLFRKILGCTLARTAHHLEAESAGIFRCFKRVLVNDSTSVSLSPKLASHFPGSGNQSNKRNAVIKVQAIVDLLSENFVDFNITAFTSNDQGAAPDILKIISPGDLIIRDLGYFVPLVFRAIIDKLAYFLSRYHHKTKLCDTNGNEIDLYALLKTCPCLDMCVHLGKEARIPVRLVCIPVPEKVANERRRKLNQNKKRDRRLNPSKEQLALCGWEIFITNVDANIWTVQDVSNAYGLRWRIEIIFKAWKSHLNFTQVTHGSKDYVLILFYTRLIFITLFQTTFVGLHKWANTNAPDHHISILKFAQFFALLVTMALGFSISNTQLLMANILKHCTYEKRRKRINYGIQKQLLLS
jgi:hypothetical protein